MIDEDGSINAQGIGHALKRSEVYRRARPGFDLADGRGPDASSLRQLGLGPSSRVA